MEQSFDFKTDGVSIEAGIIRLKDLPAIRSFVDLMVENKAGGRSYSLPSFISNIVDSVGTLGLLASSLSGRNMHPVRYICFDKTVKSNWGLPWHQDRLIALQEKRDVEGFGSWSIKQGVPHVEPPVEFLQDMITLRLHLDDCGPENGPLKVALGSCYEGRIEISDVSKIVDRSNTANCNAMAGDVVAMRGLTIHRSLPSKNPGHRRVLHIDYTSMSLPEELSWAVT